MLALGLGSAPVEPAATEPAATPLRLKWAAPEGCGSATEFRQRIDEYRLDAPIPAGGVDVRVDITGEDAGWTVALQVLLDQGVLERSFAASSCETGLDAAALMVAISLDPEAVADQLQPRPEPETEPEPEPEPKPEPKLELEPVSPAPSAPPELPPPDDPRLGLVAQLGGLVGLGELPGVGGGVTASVGLWLPWSRVELTGTYGPPRRALISAGLAQGQAGADVSMWAVGARACGEPRLRRVAFPLCVGGEGGQLLATGVNLEVSRRGQVPWGALTVSGGVSYLPTRVFGLFARAEGGVALTRQGFVIDDVGVVHRPAAGLFRAVAGVEFRWPNNLWAGRPRQE